MRILIAQAVIVLSLCTTTNPVTAQDLSLPDIPSLHDHGFVAQDVPSVPISPHIFGFQSDYIYCGTPKGYCPMPQGSPVHFACWCNGPDGKRVDGETFDTRI